MPTIVFPTNGGFPHRIAISCSICAYLVSNCVVLLCSLRGGMSQQFLCSLQTFAFDSLLPQVVFSKVGDAFFLGLFHPALPHRIKATSLASRFIDIRLAMPVDK